MNMKKIFAAVTASVLTVGAMSVAASAAITSSTSIFADDGSDNWQLFLSGDNAVAGTDGLDVTKIAAFDLYMTFDDGSSKGELDEEGNLKKEWAGGAIVLQSDSLGWNQDLGQWENAEGNKKAIENVESGKAIHCVMPVKFAAEDTYTAITVQSYGIDIDLVAVELFDESGASLLKLGTIPAAPAESTPAESTPAESTPAESTSGESTATSNESGAKDPVPTGVGGVAAVFGVVAVAAGALVVAKKRK